MFHWTHYAILVMLLKSISVIKGHIVPTKKHTPKVQSPGLVHSNKPTTKAILVLVVLAALLGIYSLYKSFAATASLSLTPAVANVPVNSTITVGVKVNSGTDTVNGAEADLIFPIDKLQFVSADSTGSAFGIQAMNTGNNTLGTVTIARGTNPGTTTSGTSQVVNVTFKAISSGSAVVSFSSSSAVLRSTDNLNVLTSKSGGAYVISAPVVVDTQAPTAPQAVTVTGQSPTSLMISWKASSDNVGVTGYRLYVNGVQKATTSATVTSSTLTGLQPGTSYSITVAAYDAAGNISAQSASASVKTYNIADVNRDGKVDIFDLSYVLYNYNKPQAQATNANADVNNSGTIDIFDLSIVLFNYNK